MARRSGSSSDGRGAGGGAARPGRLAGSGAGQRLVAPMPGKVVKVLVQVGQPVERGAGLVVLEAMKMENEFRATGSGTVREIHVEPGQAVDAELFSSSSRDLERAGRRPRASPRSGPSAPAARIAP